MNRNVCQNYPEYHSTITESLIFEKLKNISNVVIEEFGVSQQLYIQDQYEVTARRVPAIASMR